MISVGELYHPDRTRWPECSQYAYRGGDHELLLFWGRPDYRDSEAVRSGRIDLALMRTTRAVWLLYRIDGGCDWSDAPFSWHLLPDGERVPPPQSRSADERALLRAILVDASTGIVRAIRLVSMSPRMTRELDAAIAEQAAQPWDQAAYDAEIERTYLRYQHSREMVREAVVRCTGGDDSRSS